MSKAADEVAVGVPPKVMVILVAPLVAASAVAVMPAGRLVNQLAALTPVRPAAITVSLVSVIVAVCDVSAVPVVPVMVTLPTAAEGVAVGLNVCVTTKSVTAMAGMVKVKAKTSLAVIASLAATVLVTVPGAVIPEPSVALVRPTVCVPAAVAVPVSVIVTVILAPDA